MTKNMSDSNSIKYHYTNIEALVNILKTQCIRLTHCEDLDDNTEGTYLLSQLKNEFQNYDDILRNMASQFYVGCFCLNGDSKHLWDNYGKVNIGFDFEEMNNGQKFICDKNGKTHERSGVQFGECTYTGTVCKSYKNVLKDIKGRLNDIDASSIRSQQFNYLSSNRCFFIKPMKYKKEQEHRIISHLWNRAPFEADNGRKFIEFQFSTDKVRTITIGTSSERDKYRIQIEDLLSKHPEYKHVKVR